MEIVPPSDGAQMRTPWGRGFAHGSLLAAAIRSNVQNFWAACRSLRLEKQGFVCRARRMAQDYADALVEEIYSIARGSGVNADELLAYNLYRGIMFPDECTVMFAMGDATASGKVLFLKNSDKIGDDAMAGPNFYQHKEINVVLAVRSDNEPDMLGVVAAGTTGFKMGVSSLGVAVGANIARTVELAGRRVSLTQMQALDRQQLAREGLRKSTALEAAGHVVTRISAAPMSTPGNLEFVDSSNGVVIEGSYDRIALQVVKSGGASRANSFVILNALNNPGDVSSVCRYVRTQELLNSEKGNLTPESMIRFSQDHMHGPGPNSVCRHGVHYTEETSQSSMVVEIDGANPADTHFWIALGKPCHAWRNREGWIEGTLRQLGEIPAGFLTGEVWKRFWMEQPNI